ncbi:hypothetical protein GCM10009743_38120 [Kribbella swartbergensis]
MALFEAGVVADGQARQIRDLLAAKTRRTAWRTFDETHRRRSQPTATLAEERTELALPQTAPRHPLDPPDCP